MSRYIINKKGKYGFIDKNGQELIKPQFERVSEFNEGVAWAVITKNDKWISGFINQDGEWVIEPTLSAYGWGMLETPLFSEGLSPIQSDNKKMMFINKEGIAVTDAIYDEAFHFSDNRALVSRDGLFGYIDNSGKEIIKCQYGIGDDSFMERNFFSQGLAAVCFNDNDKLGYIDKNGNVVFEPKFYSANAFSEGFAMIGDGFDYYFINLKGEVPFELTTQMATSFSEGFADVYDTETELCGFINTKGKWVIKPQYKDTFRFTDGLAAIKRVGMKNKGFININGEIVIAEKFKSVLPFKNGLAYVEEKGKKGYINKLGEYVWKTK